MGQVKFEMKDIWRIGKWTCGCGCENGSSRICGNCGNYNDEESPLDEMNRIYRDNERNAQKPAPAH